LSTPKNFFRKEFLLLCFAEKIFRRLSAVSGLTSRVFGAFRGVAAIPKPPSGRKADGITARHYSAENAAG
jgi:hypothetical protein